jgi:hypothetical protein
MTKTRQVDEFGNVSYAVANDDGTPAGVIAKTCSGWAVMLSEGYVPVHSVEAGMSWLDASARILALKPVSAN